MMSTIEGLRDDETIPSMLARALRRVPVRAMVRVASYLFDHEDAHATGDLPGRLAALERNFSGRLGLTAMDLIERGTMFPLVRPFLTPDQSKRILDTMLYAAGCSSRVVRVHEVQDRSIHLRFCPLCRRNDARARDGATWWRRTLQVTGVDVCPTHGCALVDSQFVRGMNWKSIYASADDALGIEAAGVRATPDNRAVRIAKDVHWLLHSSIPPLGPLTLRDVYMERLHELGWLRESVVRRTELLESFADWMGPVLMKRRALAFDRESVFSWPIQVMLGKNNYCRPIRHLYAIAFLGLPVAEFFERARARTRLRYPPRRAASDEKIRHLKRLWNDNSKSINEIADLLGHRCQTLTRWATAHELRFPRPNDRGHLAQFHEARQRHRARWLLLRNNSDSAERRNAFKWLQRNDSSWLSRNRAVPGATNHGTRINWAQRDGRLAQWVAHHAGRIRALRPFRRICRTSLLEHAPNGGGVQVHPDRHPLTCEQIARVAESPREFVLRRILTIRRETPNLRPHQVRERAFVPPNYMMDDGVLAAIGYTHFRGRRIQRERRRAA